jgi:crotonobetainyl-CoA:carnitine CoA-transferase CaiB-like acyl-CoA transferase
MRVFDGLKVIDAAGFIAAPAAATILSDFGADVIKIEPPGEGDAFRKVYKVPNLAVSEHNYLWMQVARNRRALALDLKSAEGQAVLHRLVRAADVLITNYPLPLRPKLGLAWEQIEPLNPRLIYASLTGYGESGPEAHKPGYDATTYWARSGLADLVRPDPDGPPASAANGQGDQPSGSMLFGAIVTGLYRRERTGRGGWVGTSLLANGAWANAMSIQAALVGGEVVYRQPRTQPRNALQNTYRCADGRWFLLSLIAEDKLWPGFVRLMGLESALQDSRFATLPERRRHAVELAQELDHAFAQHDSAEWQRRFDAAGQTVGVIARTADVVNDRQMRHIGALVPGEGIPGTGLTVASPLQLGGETPVPARAAPAVGQHSDEVLREAGYAEAEIAALRARGVVA